MSNAQWTDVRERARLVFAAGGSLEDLQKSLLAVEEYAAGHPRKSDVPQRVCVKRCCAWGQVKGCTAHLYINAHLGEYCLWRTEDIRRLCREEGV